VSSARLLRRFLRAAHSVRHLLHQSDVSQVLGARRCELVGAQLIESQEADLVISKLRDEATPPGLTEGDAVDVSRRNSTART
jgi:hypothetical protein